ncbi:hypothetical protein [Paenibacillus gorillae]|uniref:hypothetical protein n=1 Tax=Paenibacillus gorillae TaxID=1243662 RepID=UPI0005A91F76|nr:hypothetical protein [Paenibacillus gorillae]
MAYINSLVGAYSNIYLNFNLTKKDNSVGKNFPENINIFNSPKPSSPIVYSLDNRSTNVSNEEIDQKLKLYISYVSQVVDTLDFPNKIKGKSLSEQYRTLNEVSALIDGFNLEK